MARTADIDLQLRARIRAWMLHFRALYYQDKTDKQLAEDLGLSASTVSGIVSGNRTAGLDVLWALRNTFRVQADILLTADPTTSAAPILARKRPRVPTS